MRLQLFPAGLLAASFYLTPALSTPFPGPGFSSKISGYWDRITAPIRSVLNDYKLALGSPDNDMNLLHEPDWMSRQPDSVPITSLTIPGTHDTMSWSPALGPIGQTQSHNLSVQYEAGVRYVDVRCRHVGNRFQIVHNVLPTGYTFNTVMELTGKFLEEHPDETVIMRLKDESYARPEDIGLDAKAAVSLHVPTSPDPSDTIQPRGVARSRSADDVLSGFVQDGGPPLPSTGVIVRRDMRLAKRLVSTRNFADTLDWYRRANQRTRNIMAKHMYTVRHKLNSRGSWETVIPTLGQLRGKFLLLSEFENARPGMGIPWYSPDKIDLEDDWFVPNTTAMATKWRAINAHMDKAHSTVPDATGKRKLFLTHLSGNSPRVWARIVALGDEKGVSGTGMNARTEDKIAKWLLEDRIHPGGVVITDFAGKGLIDSIISLNSRREREKVPKWKQWMLKVKGWLKDIFNR